MVRILSILLVALSLGIGSAHAEEVNFNASSTPLSKFAIRRLKAQGVENPQPDPGVELTGELTLPDGAGPFPALVLNHDCRGIRPYQRDFAMKAASWGVATLLIDAYGARGVEAGSVCPNIKTWDTKDFVGGRTLDVYGALGFLANHPKVDATRLGMVGWDRDTTLSAIATQGLQATFPELRPKAAVAIYPDCRRLSSGDFAVPILIVAARQDDWWPVENCEKLLAASKQAGGALVSLETVDAAHGFDDPEISEETVVPAFNPNASAQQATFHYDADAAKTAEAAARAFLEQVLRCAFTFGLPNPPCRSGCAALYRI